ncbi:MAG: UDP-N-acetylmuramoyl-L-alanyl-D-glutamate--2,6-diaminopimelate ligase [Elusimicrobia bacterium]|nr:UDP-N-acetylmuramoyl-L-alanyl-D-glutamate--2,6-diaminopimelate ligase [Elusimicrobiota bacterium]
MRLNELFADYKPQYFSGDGDTDISNIATHTSEVRKGSLFFALKGEKKDGHEFLEEAARLGAAAFVGDSKVDNPRIAQIVVEDPRLALSRWSAAFFGHPAAEMEITGVTGTNGKTTVTNLIYRILSQEGRAGLIGTSGYFYSDKKGKFSMTTPQPHELHFILRSMLDSGVKKVTMEVSSHALELKRVEDLRFHSAIFTNLTRDHLDFHKDFEHYYASKKKLFGMLSGRTGRRAFINCDDEYGKRLAKELECGPVTYGLSPDADYRATGENISMDGNTFNIVFGKEKRKVRTSLIGEFNIYNCLAAMAWAVEGGRDMQNIIQIMEKTTPVAGRLDFIRKKGKIVVIDYAHTPDALENVLRTLKKITSKKVICIFGCGGDRDRTKRPLMGKIAGVYADKVYLTSDNPRSEDPVSIILDIELGVRETDTPYFVIPDREEAIREAIMSSSVGDCILLAGKGDEQYQIVGYKVISFSDREVAEKYL